MKKDRKSKKKNVKKEGVKEGITPPCCLSSQPTALNETLWFHF